jgi:hypothetical protein
MTEVEVVIAHGKKFLLDQKITAKKDPHLLV